MNWSKALYPILFLVAYVFTASASDKKLDFSIENCPCDRSCFTDEVRNLNCSGEAAEFDANGLPDASHPIMVGIERTNQQFPIAQTYVRGIYLHPHKLTEPTETEAGPIGVAINGVPLFDPSTQGPRNAFTGKRPHTLDEGELDECGGHAGRGDDYHYHIAPKCLIEQMGADHIEVKKRPIGYAHDGFPILALGWFDDANNIESALDPCRGVTDANGQYFYNVKTTSKWDLVNCLTGESQNFDRHKPVDRRDRYGQRVDGMPIKFAISTYEKIDTDRGACHFLEGVLKNEQLLSTNGSVRRIFNKQGVIFHCSQQCYGQFFEAEKKPQFRGRVAYYDLITEGCSETLNFANYNLFEGYEGPRQRLKRRGPPKNKKKKKKKKRKKKKHRKPPRK